MAPSFLTVYFDEHKPNAEKGPRVRASMANLDYSPLSRITGRSLVVALFVSMGGLL